MIFKHDSCPFLQHKAALPLPFSVLMNRKFSAFNSNSPQNSLPLLILNKADFTSHPKRQDSSCQSSMVFDGLLKWFTATIKMLSWIIQQYSTMWSWVIRSCGKSGQAFLVGIHLGANFKVGSLQFPTYEPMRHFPLMPCKLTHWIAQYRSVLGFV